ncbi:MAG: hypothetical protein ACRCXZ_02390, partial [Patescibacteria group bacterium]
KCKIKPNLKPGESTILTFKSRILFSTPYYNYKILAYNSLDLSNPIVLSGSTLENIENYSPSYCQIKDIETTKAIYPKNILNCLPESRALGGLYYKIDHPVKFKIESITNPKYFNLYDDNLILKVGDTVTNDLKIIPTNQCVEKSIITFKITFQDSIKPNKLFNLELNCSDKLVKSDLKIKVSNSDSLKIDSTNIVKFNLSNPTIKNWKGGFILTSNFEDTKITYISSPSDLNCYGIDTTSLTCQGNNDFTLKSGSSIDIPVQVWVNRDQELNTNREYCLEKNFQTNLNETFCDNYKLKTFNESSLENLLIQILDSLRKFLKYLGL